MVRVRMVQGLVPCLAATAFAVVFEIVFAGVSHLQAQAAPAPGAQTAPAGQAPAAPPAGRQGGGGGGGGRGGRGAAPPPQAARPGAPVDLTGTWVAVVTEDWRFRMMTPPKGDYASVPLSPQGRQVADTWDPSKDGMCDAYGVGGLMRMPTRLKISWQDDNTLKIESDAGQQTRLLHFAPPGTPVSALTSNQGARSLQGYSVAEWMRSGAAFDAFLERGTNQAPRWGSLRVVTTNMLPGWLRRNGVPYSQNAVVTENFTRFTHPDAGDWFVVTTTVEDAYLNGPFITSSNFKREPNDAKWAPSSCRS
jgi:hypothetical protein